MVAFGPQSEASGFRTFMASWLYGPWDRQKYETYKLLNVVGPVSKYMDYLLDIRADNEYLQRFGMDYSDIHDPRKLSQTASAQALGREFLSVSKNVAKLYD